MTRVDLTRVYSVYTRKSIEKLARFYRVIHHSLFFSREHFHTSNSELNNRSDARFVYIHA